jgi:hypothetical protein
VAVLLVGGATLVFSLWAPDPPRMAPPPRAMARPRRQPSVMEITHSYRR